LNRPQRQSHAGEHNLFSTDGEGGGYGRVIVQHDGLHVVATAVEVSDEAALGREEAE
jgi:hypothetical protein